MIKSLKASPGDYIVEWSYTKQEWKQYMLWSARRKTVFHYARFLFFPPKVAAPQVAFTRDSIWINGRRRMFNESGRDLRRVEILDKGLLNIVVVIFHDHSERLQEIIIPIPHGKLKEAVQLLEILSTSHP